MGKPSPDSRDTGLLAVTGALAATGPSEVHAGVGRFNVSLRGTWAGTVAVERSFDGGTTWGALTNLGAAVAFTANAEEVLLNHESGVLHRLSFTRTSGTLEYRISQ